MSAEKFLNKSNIAAFFLGIGSGGKSLLYTSSLIVIVFLKVHRRGGESKYTAVSIF
jgi:hypothetical protein